MGFGFSLGFWIYGDSSMVCGFLFDFLFYFGFYCDRVNEEYADSAPKQVL